ncbi:MAG: metallophosphoesterase [Victivallales bacterium]|nr:metallophosphoesterase [Victivallales bacterium]
MFVVSLIEAQVLTLAGILPLPVKVLWKVCLLCFALLASFKFHLLHLIGGGRFFAPDLPQWVILPMSWLHAAGVIMCLLLSAASLLRLLTLFWLRFSAGRWFSWSCPALTWGIAGIAVISLLAAGWGLWRGRSMPLVREMEVAVADLPDSAEGFRLVHLSDIHVDSLYPAGRYSEIAALVNTLNADAVAITGDFADGGVEELGAHFSEAPRMQARYGVFGASGNHDFYSGYDRWRELLEASGIQMLDNRCVTLSCGIAVGGVTDLAAHRFREFPMPDVKGTVNSAGGEMPVILLSHQPKAAPEAAASGAVLQLSGHTHGGMLPGLASMVAASNNGFVRGLYQVGRMKLYVSNGTGIWSGFPIRLGCPPEIAVITLRRERTAE